MTGKKKGLLPRELKMPVQDFKSYTVTDVLSGYYKLDRAEWAKQMWFVHSFNVLEGMLIVLYEQFDP